jgi:predicted permease
MNFARGIIAASIWAGAGPILTVLVVAGFQLLSWQFNNTPEIDRKYDMAWWRMHAVPPLVGISIYLGTAALATYTPHRNQGFAKTLAILFGTALPFTWFLAQLELTPKRYKSIEHPDLYFSEFLLLFLPPLVIAGVLMAVRRSESRSSETAS